MCLDYLWVSNLYGPSTTQPRPKIKTFLGAQDTLILFNVPAPYIYNKYIYILYWY